MPLKKKLMLAGLVGLTLVAFVPLAAQADTGAAPQTSAATQTGATTQTDTSKLFATQRRVYGSMDTAPNQAVSAVTPLARMVLQANPCLGLAVKQAVSAIESSPSYAAALNNYHTKCSSSSSSSNLGDPTFLITPDYEAVPNQNPNYSVSLSLSVEFKNRPAKSLWSSGGTTYVAAVDTGLKTGTAFPASCPNVPQWVQKLNIPSVQSKIVAEMTADSQSCSPQGGGSGLFDDGIGDQSQSGPSKSPAQKKTGSSCWGLACSSSGSLY